MNPARRTKIVATLGPKSEDPKIIKELIRAGVNVFRFNLKHNDLSWHAEKIKLAKKISRDLGMDVGILIDLQGPEIRIETRGQGVLNLAKGAVVSFVESFKSDEDEIRIPERRVWQSFKKGDRLLIDDGLVELTVIRKEGRRVFARALNAGLIADGKSLNLPRKPLNLPSLSENDFRALDLFANLEIDFIALSFCRRASDVENLKKAMRSRGFSAAIVAKIESREALNNLSQIIPAAEAIMVARGDLGVEVPIEELAFWQKRIIEEARLLRKPVIVATQMLESMVKNPRPTRAEATDVANSVFDGTDAVMLSEETANGAYPLKSVEEMARILRYNEAKATIPSVQARARDVTEMIIDAAMTLIAEKQTRRIDAAVVLTQTGYTARALSSFRPKTTIIAVTEESATVASLNMSYGVYGFKTEFPKRRLLTPSKIIERLRQRGFLSKGQTALVVHGQHGKTPGLTNSLSLSKV